MRRGKEVKEPRIKAIREKMPKQKGIMPMSAPKARVSGMHPTENLIVNAKSMGGY